MQRSQTTPFLFSVISAFFFVFPIVASAQESFPALEVMNAVNQERAVHGLLPLTTSSLLGNAAQGKAQDMVTKKYFAHTSPDGDTPWTWISETGYAYVRAAENLAAGYVTAPDVVAGWMSSAGHRENMLSSDFTEFGAAVTVGQSGETSGTIVVLLFATPKESAQTAPPLPQPVQAASTPPAPIPPPAPPVPEVPAETPISVSPGPVSVQETPEPALPSPAVPQKMQTQDTEPDMEVPALAGSLSYSAVDNFRKLLLRYLLLLLDLPHFSAAAIS